MDTPAITDSAAPAPGRSRRNRGSEVVRTALINAAAAEFAAHGFEGASTRRIAEAASAHQSQIKYHFDTKDELWRRCIALLLEDLDALILENLDLASDDPRAAAEAAIRGLVQFMSIRPELNRIMMHEAMSNSGRLTWLVDTFVRPRHVALTQTWEELVAGGLVAPIDSDLLYHTVIGAASLVYSNAPEAELLGITPSDPDLVKRHTDTLVALFLRR